MEQVNDNLDTPQTSKFIKWYLLASIIFSFTQIILNLFFYYHKVPSFLMILWYTINFIWLVFNIVTITIIFVKKFKKKYLVVPILYFLENLIIPIAVIVATILYINFLGIVELTNNETLLIAITISSVFYLGMTILSCLFIFTLQKNSLLLWIIGGVALVSVVTIIFPVIKYFSKDINQEKKYIQTSVETIKRSLAGPSPTKKDWAIYTNLDYKFSIEYPWEYEAENYYPGGTYMSTYEINTIDLPTLDPDKKIYLTLMTFSDTSVNDYKKNWEYVGGKPEELRFYYSLPKMREAITLSLGQSCQVLDENNIRYSEAPSRPCTVTSIDGQVALQIMPAPYSIDTYITYFIPREDSMWLEIRKIPSSYSDEVMNTLKLESLTASQNVQQLIQPVLVKDLQEETLKQLGWSWYGPTPVYGSILDWADINTLEIYKGTPYVKDKNGVYSSYFGGISRMEGADPNTFIVYSYELAKDKNHIYITGVTEYPQDLDVPTFQKVGANYFKDKNLVYLGDVIFEKKYNQLSHWRLEKILELHAPTFQYLNICGCVEKSCTFYTKDKQGVYCGYDNNFEKIQGADSSTFEYVESYSPGEMLNSGIAKDKFCVYNGGEKVVDANNVCINPSTCTSDNLVAGCGLK